MASSPCDFSPIKSFQVVFYHTSYPDGKPVVFIGIHSSIKPIAHFGTGY